MKFIGVFDYTVILTYTSLFSAFFGMVQAHKGHYTFAILCLLLSGICDAFDGIVARSKKDRTEDEKAFGIQLDSLCDVVSFGVFPAFLCYNMGVSGVLGIVILCAFCMCGVSRLAFFNVAEGKRQQAESGTNKAYRGLPITCSSIILPLFYLVRFVLRENLFIALLHAVLILTAFLFVFDFTVPKYDLKKLLIKAKIMKD